MTPQPRVLLVVGGGIAAYKSCELVRLMRKGGADVTCVLTGGGAQFVTEMSLAALSGNPVHTSLWDAGKEARIGHIQLSRAADLVVICPATADLLAKMSAGIADDLATTMILATDKPVLAVPAMNVRMWDHAATRRNVEWLRQAGVRVLDPDEGPMACGEFGPGRLPEVERVWAEIALLLGMDAGLPSTGAMPSQPGGYAYEALEPEDENDEDTQFAGGAIAGADRGAADADIDRAGTDGGDDRDGGEEHARSGLAGLLASIIPRATPRKEPADWPEEPSAPSHHTFGQVDASQETEAPVGEEVPEAGPLLARKGAARAAPPTDAEAINHEVDTRRQSPQPSAPNGDAAGRDVDVPAMAVPDDKDAFDPLDGQPDFERDPEHRPLYGKHVLVTAGPTHEPIDPVRYIANRSSGKQGFAIAAAAAAAGARVTLVSGPVALDTPPGVERIDVESAQEMAQAVRGAMPADAAVMVAAVADWRTREYADEKMKKRGSAPPALLLTENPDILINVATGTDRPRLVVGFAAETENVVDNARRKRRSKGADWIVANDVSGDVMGGDRNTVHILSEHDEERWDEMSKQDVARRLVERMAEALNDG